MKMRSLLQLGSKSLFPTKLRRWEACQRKLDAARCAIDTMSSVEDRVAFEEAWSTLLDSIEESWTRFFDEGKTVSSKFQPWAGAKDKERRADYLLRYLIESRHLSQHGGPELSWTAQKVALAPGFSGHIKSVKAWSDGTVEIEGSPMYRGGEDKLRLIIQGGEPSLPNIENRGKEYMPPAGTTPIEAALAGVEFYSQVFDEAAAKFGLAT